MLKEAYTHYVSKQKRVQTCLSNRTRLVWYITIYSNCIGWFPSKSNLGFFYSIVGFQSMNSLILPYISLMVSRRTSMVSEVLVRYLCALLIAKWFYLFQVVGVFVFLQKFMFCHQISHSSYSLAVPMSVPLRNPFLELLEEEDYSIFLKPDPLDYLAELPDIVGYNPTFCVVIYKITETNVYVTITNLFGDVLISRSAGSLGIRKRWERQYPSTFAKLLDVCLRFVQKHKLADHMISQLPSYRMGYNKVLY